MKKLLSLLLVIVMLTGLFGFVGCGKTEPLTGYVKAADSADGYATVYIPEGRGLKVLQLTDPQMDNTWKYSEVGSDTDGSKTLMLIEKLVKATQPDLIIITGDLVMAVLENNWGYAKRYADLLDSLKVPWTFTFGNHDCEAGYASFDDTSEESLSEVVLQISKPLFVSKFAEYQYCLASSDEACEEGFGNHFINVRDSKGALVYTLCMLDCCYDGTNDYSRVITEKQIQWYENTIKKLSDAAYGTGREATNVVKSMVYTHVGLPEFNVAWKEAWNNGEPNENYYYGHHMDGNYTKYGSEDDFFNRALALGSTTAVFFGHHHDNDFSVNYKGIRLTFGQHSGISHNYRTVNVEKDGKKVGFDFSRIKKYGDQRGGTMATINADGTFSIAPQYATEVIPDYDDFRIDYAAVVEQIRADGKYYVVGWDD